MKKDVSTESILELKEQGLTYKQIAEKVGMSAPGVANRIAKAKKKGVVSETPHPQEEPQPQETSRLRDTLRPQGTLFIYDTLRDKNGYRWQVVSIEGGAAVIKRSGGCMHADAVGKKKGEDKQIINLAQFCAGHTDFTKINATPVTAYTLSKEELAARYGSEKAAPGVPSPAAVEPEKPAQAEEEPEAPKLETQKPEAVQAKPETQKPSAHAKRRSDAPSILMTREEHEKKRINAISGACQLMMLEESPIPIEWVIEYNELVEKRAG